MAFPSDSALNINKIISQQLLCQKVRSSHSLGIFYRENPLEFSFSLILLEIALVILLSRAVRFLLRPLRQPRIVSDIIGGICIGPSVLGCSKTFTSIVFPENAQFIVRNVGIMGLMYFIFLSGVKMDLSLASKTGRKQLYIAILGVVCPFLATGITAFLLRPSMDIELAKVSGFGAVAADLALTSFPVIYIILRELNLLSSEIGRMALTTAVVSDSLGVIAIVVFESLKQAEGRDHSAIWFWISSGVLGAFMLIPIRRMLRWIVKNTPDGKPVDQNIVILSLLAVLVIGFFTDMFGLAIATGSLWLGLIIPDGPPLGAAIVERSETIVVELFMPFAFAVVGLFTDVFSMAEYGWSKLAPLFALVIIGYSSKLIIVFVAALFFDVPLKDSLTLSLILNLRGQLELLIFLHWLDKKIVGFQQFTLLVILTTLITGICTPLISILYNPAKPYMVNKRRTIQHSPPGKELRMVVCIHNKENVVGLIDLLEVSYPTTSNPFSIYALHLVELVGRATTVLIDHQLSTMSSKDADHEIIRNALNQYQEARNGFVNLNFFTALTVRRTMYQDICKLALLNKASLIILPFEKGKLETLAGTEIVRHGRGMQSINVNVLTHAPCSVGILVDKGNAHSAIVVQPFRHSSRYKYVVLFLGGPDSREALTYADRMAANPDVYLTVVRFLSHNNRGDDEMEKKLDDGLVTWFWVKNEANERVAYKEVVVRNGEETLAAIQAFNSSDNDLWIVGRKQGINPMILQGLSNWSENLELGVIGDFIASFDFNSTASVLVLHQQVMRVHGTK